MEKPKTAFPWVKLVLCVTDWGVTMGDAEHGSTRHVLHTVFGGKISVWCPCWTLVCEILPPSPETMMQMATVQGPVLANVFLW